MQSSDRTKGGIRCAVGGPGSSALCLSLYVTFSRWTGCGNDKGKISSRIPLHRKREGQKAYRRLALDRGPASARQGRQPRHRQHPRQATRTEGGPRQVQILFVALPFPCCGGTNEANPPRLLARVSRFPREWLSSRCVRLVFFFYSLPFTFLSSTVCLSPGPRLQEKQKDALKSVRRIRSSHHHRLSLGC
jgi:hypothetical protein